MAGEQTSYVGDDIKVLVNVIDSTGSHVAATINTSTTRLNGFSTIPTINTIGTGIYEVVFASVTPAPSEGDRLIGKECILDQCLWNDLVLPGGYSAEHRQGQLLFDLGVPEEGACQTFGPWQSEIGPLMLMHTRSAKSLHAEHDTL